MKRLFYSALGLVSSVSFYFLTTFFRQNYLNTLFELCFKRPLRPHELVRLLGYFNDIQNFFLLLGTILSTYIFSQLLFNIWPDLKKKIFQKTQSFFYSYHKQIMAIVPLILIACSSIFLIHFNASDYYLSSFISFSFLLISIGFLFGNLFFKRNTLIVMGGIERCLCGICFLLVLSSVRI